MEWRGEKQGVTWGGGVGGGCRCVKRGTIAPGYSWHTSWKTGGRVRSRAGRWVKGGEGLQRNIDRANLSHDHMVFGV